MKSDRRPDPNKVKSSQAETPPLSLSQLHTTSTVYQSTKTMAKVTVEDEPESTTGTYTSAVSMLIALELVYELIK
jgi:hypothetical protein